MAPKTPVRLVIDASVACTAGEFNVIDPASKNCREFLLVIRKTKHLMVLTPAIVDEWNKHASLFATTWRVSMRNRRQVCDVRLAEQIDLVRAILDTARPGGCLAIMQKDMHLILAALATDQTVVALDDHAREQFRFAAFTVSAVACVVWVNPGNVEEELTKWLAAGAKPEAKRRLGHMEGP